METLSLEDFGVLAEIISALAVVITLGYLAIQIKHSNNEASLQSMQYVWSGLSEYCDQITQSEEMTAIILRGRQSLEKLNENELERFTHIHLRLINTIECWLMVISEGYQIDKLSAHHKRNIDGIIAGYFNYSGTLKWWKSLEPAYAMPELHELVLKNTDYKE